MKKCFEVVLGGILVFWPMLAAPAQEPVRIVVAEQGGSTLTPAQGQVQYDEGLDPNVAPRVVHGPFDEGGHFIAGAGVYIVKPYFQNNPAFFSQTSTTTSGPGTFSFETSTTQHDFCWCLNTTPVVWLGYVSECGLGVRTRWWLFDQESGGSIGLDPNTTLISAAPGGLAIASPRPPVAYTVALSPSSTPMFLGSNLKLNVWDFEAIKETELGHWGLLFAAGVRYAHLSQDYRAFEVSNPPPFTFPPSIGFREVNHLSSGHNFNGAGPTLAIEAKRPIGNSRFSLFGNLRGAMLFGDSKLQVTRVIQTGALEQNVATATFQSAHDTVLPVAELEMGVEYSRTWGRIRPFLRTGLVAQTWFDAGSATKLDGNLGFLGLSVTAGLNY
jgi:hypothetical protein